MQQHPWVEWVGFEPIGRGLYQAQCSACGAAVQGTGDKIDAFAQQHSEHRSQAQGFYGLGDAFAAAAGAIGAEPCAPCEARREAMNRWVPRVWRR